MEGAREFDVCLFGATGFTGFLTAEYLSKVDGLSFAIAGRSAKKLEIVAKKLGDPENMAIIVADTSNYGSLLEMTERCRVLASTVGPYSLYGEPVVRACVESQTHYCDITGEFPFIRKMIDKYHDSASMGGTKIVCTCGYDCIPVDFAAYLVTKDLPSVTTMRGLCTKANGSASGGTLATIKAAGEWASAPENKKLAEDPYVLAPGIAKSSRVDTVSSSKTSVGWDAEFKTVSIPYPMAGTDNRVVRRSLFLRGITCGYDESLSAGAAFSLVKFALTHITSFVGLAARRPGQGPSEAVQKDGSFEIQVRGTDDDGGICAYSFTGEGDPGYRATSVMLAESALCLAFDTASISPHGGVLTPSTAMGEPLLKRLRNTGRFAYNRIE